MLTKQNPTPLFLSADPNDELHAYCYATYATQCSHADSDWSNSAMHWSTTGYVIFHGTNLNPISSVAFAHATEYSGTVRG